MKLQQQFWEKLFKVSQGVRMILTPWVNEMIFLADHLSWASCKEACSIHRNENLEKICEIYNPCRPIHRYE